MKGFRRYGYMGGSHKQRGSMLFCFTCRPKLQTCLPVLATVVLFVNLFGYYAGYVSFHYNTQTTVNMFQQQQYRHRHGPTPKALGAPTPGAPAARRTTFSARSAYSYSGNMTHTVVQHTEPCRITQTTERLKTDGRWFNYSIPTLQFYAYTALWDDRPTTGLGHPVIRIIAVSSIRNMAAMTDNQNQLTNFYLGCTLHFIDSNGNRRTETVAADASALPIGWGWYLNNEMIREFIFTCPPTSADKFDGVTKPVAVSLVVEDRSPASSWTSCMPIDYPSKPAQKRHLAICVQVAFDKLDPLRLVEWFELQKLLGVDMVGVYNLSLVEGPGADVLRHYAKGTEPFVDLRRSDYIPDGPMQYLMHGSPVINDCVYRHMHRFEHIAVIDFDEAIVPRGSMMTLPELVKELQRVYSTKQFPPLNYIFSNNYFFTDFPQFPLTSTLPGNPPIPDSTPDSLLASHLTMLEHRRKAPVSGYGYAVKSIVDPQACVQVHNHYCWSVTAGYTAQGYVEIVSDSLAVNQHYKDCHLNKTECDAALHGSTMDSIVSKYRSDLLKNVAEQIKMIFNEDVESFLKRLKYI